MVVINNYFFEIKRLWKNNDIINIKFLTDTKITKRPTGGAAVEKGPLIFSLRIDEEISFKFNGIGDCPFSPDGAPITATAKGRKIPEWKIEHNAAGELPESPVSSTEPLEEITLIPYGRTNLRITEFPVIIK